MVSAWKLDIYLEWLVLCFIRHFNGLVEIMCSGMERIWKERLVLYEALLSFPCIWKDKRGWSLYRTTLKPGTS